MPYDEREYNEQNPKITFRVTKGEKQKLQQMAKMEGKSLADWVRDALVTRSSPGKITSSPGKSDGDRTADLGAALRELWRFFNIVAEDPARLDSEMDKLDIASIDKGVKLL